MHTDFFPCFNLAPGRFVSVRWIVIAIAIQGYFPSRVLIVPIFETLKLVFRFGPLIIGKVLFELREHIIPNPTWLYVAWTLLFVFEADLVRTSSALECTTKAELFCLFVLGFTTAVKVVTEYFYKSTHVLRISSAILFVPCAAFWLTLTCRFRV